jgi:hypothetical protein
VRERVGAEAGEDRPGDAPFDAVVLHVITELHHDDLGYAFSEVTRQRRNCPPDAILLEGRHYLW